jgi:hypothetical protein
MKNTILQLETKSFCVEALNIEVLIIGMMLMQQFFDAIQLFVVTVVFTWSL